MVTQNETEEPPILYCLSHVGNPRRTGDGSDATDRFHIKSCRLRSRVSPHLNMWVAPKQQHVSPGQSEVPPWVSTITITQPCKDVTAGGAQCIPKNHSIPQGRVWSRSSRQNHN